jgi:branched-chain amino acid transport system permease protein
VPPATYRSKTEESLRRLFRNPLGLALLIIVALLVLTYPFLDETFGFRKITIVVPILMYILLALGLNVVVGYAGLLDLGYAAFFAIGAYAAAFITSPQSVVYRALHDWGLGALTNFWVAIIVAFFIAVIAGMVLGAPTLRLRGDYLAIVTLGFGEIVPIVFRNAIDLTNGEKGMGGIAKPEIFGFEIGGQPVLGLGVWSSQLPWYYLLLIIGVIAVIGLRRLQDSRVGRAWMAMREDEISSAAMGVNLVTTKLSAFAMGASLSGVVGAVYGAYVSLVHPSAFEFSTSVILLCAVILGGLGNIWGVILGAFIILFFDRILTIEISGWLQDLGTTIGNNYLATFQLSDWRFFLFGVALVVLMLVRPEGIIPSARRRAELRPELDTPEVIEEDEPGVEPPRETVQAQQTLYDSRDQDESIQEKR